MSLVSDDDAAFLAILWLVVVAFAGCLWAWAVQRVERAERRRRRPLPPPDRTVHRTGSVVDFHARRNAQRWP